MTDLMTDQPPGQQKHPLLHFADVTPIRQGEAAFPVDEHPHIHRLIEEVEAQRIRHMELIVAHPHIRTTAGTTVAAEEIEQLAPLQKLTPAEYVQGREPYEEMENHHFFWQLCTEITAQRTGVAKILKQASAGLQDVAPTAPQTAPAPALVHLGGGNPEPAAQPPVRSAPPPVDRNAIHAAVSDALTEHTTATSPADYMTVVNTVTDLILTNLLGDTNE